jgi:hypothetical protein
MLVDQYLAIGLSIRDIFELGAGAVIDWVENLIPLISIGGQG